MGMFSTNGFYVEGASFNDEDIIAQECFEDNMHVAALRVVAESENNWNQIMQAMAISELAAYEETGDANYYITESGSGFLESVKAFFTHFQTGFIIIRPDYYCFKLIQKFPVFFNPVKISCAKRNTYSIQITRFNSTSGINLSFSNKERFCRVNSIHIK